MPIIIPKELPAYKVLEKEDVFVITKNRAVKQDIRAIKIAILNLMPNKIVTEFQLLRALSYSPLQLDIKLISMGSHKSKNTSELHLKTFYESLKEIEKEKFDGLIITGAPVETLAFEKVNYWKELKEIFEYSKENVFSTLHICFGAQAGLYYHYNIKKILLKEKMFGIYKNTVVNQNSLLTRGLDKNLWVPQSRYTGLNDEEIIKNTKLKVLMRSNESGINLIEANNLRQIFTLGHPEYDIDTLDIEYKRDLNKKIKISIPKNYYQHDDPKKKIIANFKGNSNLFFVNWVNFIYQKTPYDLNDIKLIK